ncbi:MAG TPA: hypothetical protein VH914_00535 [Acidimicrobiia bacterium]|nr:hypothetical protein [Acidimicrobiia bacterium]
MLIARAPKEAPVKLSPAVVDFVERVGATAFEAGAAVYIADPRASTAKAAAIAAAIAAIKFVYLKVGAWQASKTEREGAPFIPLEPDGAQ